MSSSQCRKSKTVHPRVLNTATRGDTALLDGCTNKVKIILLAFTESSEGLGVGEYKN